MTTWYEATQDIVGAANAAMGEIAATRREDRDEEIRAVWEPVANALLASVRDDLSANWPEESKLANDLGPDFVGQTSDTGRIVSWGPDNGVYRTFVIH